MLIQSSLGNHHSLSMLHSLDAHEGPVQHVAASQVPSPSPFPSLPLPFFLSSPHPLLSPCPAWDGRNVQHKRPYLIDRATIAYDRYRHDGVGQGSACPWKPNRKQPAFNVQHACDR